MLHQFSQPSQNAFILKIQDFKSGSIKLILMNPSVFLIWSANRPFFGKFYTFSQVKPLTVIMLFFALAVWTCFNLFIRFCMRSKVLRRLIKGDSVYLVKNGAINFKAFKRNSLEMEQFRLLLRQKGVFSMFEVDDVRFETNGAITVSEVGKVADSYLLVNNGAIVDSSLFHCGKTRQWVLRHIKHYGYEGPTNLFCMEWTPGKGFYLVAKNGDVKRGSEEIAAEEIAQEVLN